VRNFGIEDAEISYIKRSVFCMPKIKIIAIVTVAIVAAVLLVGCNCGNGGNDIVGRWEYIGVEIDGEFFEELSDADDAFEFNRDSSGIMRERGYNLGMVWSTRDSRLTMEFFHDGEPVGSWEAYFQISGNRLYLADQRDFSQVFRRVR